MELLWQVAVRSTAVFVYSRIQPTGPCKMLLDDANNMVYFVRCEGGGDRGGTLIKVLCYKFEGRWFDSR